MPAHHQQQRYDEDRQRLKYDAAHHRLVLLETGGAGAVLAGFQILLGGLEESDDALDEHEQRRAHGGDQQQDEKYVHAATLGACQPDANRKAIAAQVVAQAGRVHASAAQLGEGYSATALGEAIALCVDQ